MQAFEPSGFGGSTTAKKHGFNSILGVQNANAIGVGMLKLVTPIISTPPATVNELNTIINGEASASFNTSWVGVYNAQVGFAAYFYNACYVNNVATPLCITTCLSDGISPRDMSATRNGYTLWSRSSGQGMANCSVMSPTTETLGTFGGFQLGFTNDAKTGCQSGQINICSLKPAGSSLDVIVDNVNNAVAKIVSVVAKSPGFVSTGNILNDLNSQSANYSARVTNANLQGSALNLLITNTLQNQTNPVIKPLQNQAMWDIRTVGSGAASGFYPFESAKIPSAQNKLLFIARDVSTNYIGAELTGTNTAAVTANMPAFSSAFALRLDQKFDDGKPYSGNIIAGQNISDNTATIKGKGCTTMTTSFASMAAGDLTAAYNNTGNLATGCVLAGVING